VVEVPTTILVGAIAAFDAAFGHDLLENAAGQLAGNGQADALRAAGSDMTDEASAIEKMGLQPRLVESDSRNLKVTYPRDLELASMILKKMHERHPQ